MDNSTSPTEYVLFFAAIAAGIAFYYLLIRTAVKYGTRRQRDYQEAQTSLLIEIAKIKGVDEEKINQIDSKLRASLKD